MADSFVQLNNDGPGKKIDTRTENVNGDHRQVMVVGDPVTNANVANVSAAGALQVDGSAVTQPVSVTNTVTTAPPSNASTNLTQISGSAITEGQKAMAASLPIVIASDQSAVPISAASLPLPAGASTSANQSTTNTTLSSILINTPAVGQTTMAGSSPVVIASNQSSIPVTLASTTVTGNVTVVQPTGTNLHTVVDSGTITLSGTSPVSGTVTANQGTANTSANKWPIAIVDSGGVNVASVNATNELLVTDTDLTLSQASATSGQQGPLIQGAVTTSAPTYVTAQTNPLSLTTAGALRTDASATTQPISGTVTSNQGTANATPWNENIAQIAGAPASTSATGVLKVGISGATAVTLDAAQNAAAPTNELVVGGVYQTTIPVLTATNASQLQVDSTGALAVNTEGRKASYSAGILSLAIAATPTDIFTIFGSGTKTIRVLRLTLSGTQTTAGEVSFQVLKRSAANTGGTSTNPAAVPHDSNNAAATATVTAYTANPTALGAQVGSVLATDKIFAPPAAATTAGTIDVIEWGSGIPEQGIVLRGTTQGLCVNLNAAAATLTSANIWIDWTEE